jgi:two-component system, LuxR family, sensor kinase FixL
MDAHQLYSNLVEHIPLGVIVWHLPDLQNVSTFRLIAMNSTARQMLGVSGNLNEADLVHDPFPAFLKIESPSTYADIIRANQSRDLSEIHYRNEQHVERILLVRAFPLPDQQLGVLFEDITDRKQTEDALRQLERKLLFHLQQTLLAVIEWNLDLKVMEWNPAAEKIFAYPRRDALGQSILNLIVPVELREGMERILRDLSTFRTSISHTNQNIAGDGRMIICEWYSTPLIDEEDNIIGVLSLVHDITKRQQAEADLKQFAERLAQSNQELQEFASIASHDLQEPLRKIQAFGDRLKSKYANSLSDEGLDYLNRMHRAAERMQTLINDLLTFSRVTTKTHPFTMVDLNQLVQDVLSDLEIHLQHVEGTVTVSNLPTIEADPMQMRQLLQNLLSNALKFHKPGVAPVIKLYAQPVMLEAIGCSIKPSAAAYPSLLPSVITVDDHSIVSTSSQNLPALYCQLRVVDNGIGFDEKYLDRIFTIFQRLHDRQEYQGTGMGLAICRKIVERHHGHITAESQVGEGSTFVVTLPMQQTPAPHRQHPPLKGHFRYSL